MDDRQAFKEVGPDTTEEINNVVQGDFALMRQPVDYQLTIHVNNLLNTYGKGIIKEFKEMLYNPDDQMYGSQIRRLVNHYGLETVRNWFTLIYGWQFDKVG